MTLTEPARREGVSEANLLHKYVHDRLSQLWAARQIFRRQSRADWSTARWECEVELRALLTLARSARRLAAAEPDPIDRYRSWTESEMAYAAGR